MSTTDPILLAIDGGIATVIFNRPERRNAITFAMWNHLQRLLVDLKEDPAVRVIVFRGAGGAAFSAGADISEFATHRNNAAKATLYNAAFDAAMDMAEAVGKPTLCLIEGVCVGGGCEFSTACDVRIASENARMGVPIARLGLPIAYREMRRMVRLIGHAKTMELLLTAAIIPAAEAHAIGLVNHVVPAADVEAFTYDMAKPDRRPGAGGAPRAQGNPAHRSGAPGAGGADAGASGVGGVALRNGRFPGGLARFSGKTPAAVSGALGGPEEEIPACLLYDGRFFRFRHAKDSRLDLPMAGRFGQRGTMMDRRVVVTGAWRNDASRG